jgi:RNA polymerase sigma factor
MVIDRRIKNYLKKESKHAKVVSLSSFGTGSEQMYSIAENDSIVVHFERFETRSEIELFKESLKEFGIEMQELLKAAPKHTDARITCIKIARLITENDEMYQKLTNKKVLPVKDILMKFNISERTLERNRKYIIASCVVIKSGLDIVKGFLLELEGREKQ